MEEQENKNIVKVDSIFLTTTIVKFLRNNQYYSATGFFFSDKENNVYLVTNKHVIYGKDYSHNDSKPKIDELRLILHSDQNNLSKNEEVSVNLYKEGEQIWKEHNNKEIDVICIPINLDRHKFIFVTIGNDLLDFSNLKIGFEKIFVMGYPYGWYDILNNLPITRVGHLSSPFGVAFQGKPFMLGDVETHKGMSGSPVFMYLKDYITEGADGRNSIHVGTLKMLLVGVFSGQPIWRTKENKEIPHSLSIIWFSEIIKEIVNC
ncbi:MAG: serine protease [Candidatus Pacebacteria bacterium]|nr:serine protease [Candidatus Paceibacterota bacterium]